MSIEAMNWALSVKTGAPSTKAVLLILANRADHQGRCWPGIDGIAEQTELSRRSVIQHIQKLEAHKLLTVEHRGGSGEGRKSNVYVLHIGQCADFAHRGNVQSVQGQCADSAGQCAAGAPEPTINPQGNPQEGRKPKIDWSAVPNLNLDAWATWLEDRRRRRLPAYKTTIEAKRLAELTHEKQAECVNYSLDRYRGLVHERFTEHIPIPAKAGKKSFGELMEGLSDE